MTISGLDVESLERNEWPFFHSLQIASNNSSQINKGVSCVINMLSIKIINLENLG